MIRLFRGTCLAVSAMHDYRGPAPKLGQGTTAENSQTPTSQQMKVQATHDDEDDDESDDDDDDDGPKGNSHTPLVAKKRANETADVVFDADAPSAGGSSAPTNGQDAVHTPYAHRDIKPG